VIDLDAASSLAAEFPRARLPADKCEARRVDPGLGGGLERAVALGREAKVRCENRAQRA